MAPRGVLRGAFYMGEKIQNGDTMVKGRSLWDEDWD